MIRDMLEFIITGFLTVPLMFVYVGR